MSNSKVEATDMTKHVINFLLGLFGKPKFFFADFLKFALHVPRSF